MVSDTPSAATHHLIRERRECRYCSTIFRPHPGFADHEDKCRLNPMNRPHIKGEAVAYYG